MCHRVWTEKWFYIVVRQIHHPVDPLPLCKVPDTLEKIEHKGMNKGCKDYILSWLRESCDQVWKEEKLTDEIIQAVLNVMD